MDYFCRALATALVATCTGCNESDRQPVAVIEPENITAPTSESTPVSAEPTNATDGYKVIYYNREELTAKLGDSASVPPALEDTTWLLVAYGYTDEFTRIVPANNVHFSVAGDPPARIGGNDGCNQFMGVLQATAEGWVADSIIGTLKGCYLIVPIGDEQAYSGQQQLSDLYAAQQSFFYDVITNVTNIKIENGILLLTNAESKMLALTRKSTSQ